MTYMPLVQQGKAFNGQILRERYGNVSAHY
jgi:hypothetical protein